MTLIITLIILGIILLLLGLLIFPGFGIPEILGIVSLVSGVVLAYYIRGAVVGHIVLGSAILLCVILLVYALRTNTWQRLSLQDNITAQALRTAEEQGLTVGMQGITVTRLAPMGTVKFDHIKTEATAYKGMIQPAKPIEIVKIERTKIIVKEITN